MTKIFSNLFITIFISTLSTASFADNFSEINYSSITTTITSASISAGTITQEYIEVADSKKSPAGSITLNLSGQLDNIPCNKDNLINTKSVPAGLTIHNLTKKITLSGNIETLSCNTSKTDSNITEINISFTPTSESSDTDPVQNFAVMYDSSKQTEWLMPLLDNTPGLQQAYTKYLVDGSFGRSKETPESQSPFKFQQSS